MTGTPEWVIHPREKDLSRLYDPLTNWESLVLIERYNTPDTWVVSGPSDVMSVFAPGSGCILDRNGVQVTSGRVTNITRTGSVSDGRMQDRMTVAFASDLMPLGGRVVFPSPEHNLTTAISQFPASYDLRTGAIETLIIEYVRYHAGNLAQIDRQISRLRLPVSLGRGGSTQVSARLDNLGVLVQTLADAGDLRVRIVHTEETGGTWLDLIIDPVQDLSNDVRFGTADTMTTGIIADWTYEVGIPDVTRAVVAGGGELSAREFLQIDSLAPEALWGVAVEKLIDQRHVSPTSPDKLSELTRGGNEAIESGAGPTRVVFVPMLGPDLEYRKDLRIGDIVGYDLPGIDPDQDKIREAKTVVTVEDNVPTEQVSITIGTPDAPTTRTQQQAARALRAVNVIQRS